MQAAQWRGTRQVGLFAIMGLQPNTQVEWAERRKRQASEEGTRIGWRRGRRLACLVSMYPNDGAKRVRKRWCGVGGSVAPPLGAPSNRALARGDAVSLRKLGTCCWRGSPLGQHLPRGVRLSAAAGGWLGYRRDCSCLLFRK